MTLPAPHMQQYYFVCHANLALFLGLFCHTRFMSKKESTNQRVRVHENITLYRGIVLTYWDFTSGGYKHEVLYRRKGIALAGRDSS